MIEKIYAQITNPVLSGNLGKGTNETGLANTGKFISSLVSLFLIITAVASLVFLIIGGVTWVLSDGDKGKLEQARNRIIQAIIGLIVVAASWAIWILLGNFLGINFKELPFPTLGS